MFDALGISGTGMGVHQKWMDALSDNIANVNTVRPTSESAFRARWVVAQSIEDGGTGQGVRVAGIELGSQAGRLVYSPDHPLADAKGYVRMPDIDMAEQMSDLILAQRGYQMNIASLDRVRASYQAAIQMGRG
ncbi:flagellar basal body rod protein FlgC [Kineosporia sp. R_H_3]|uniref:flagellar basal body rod protein FlgC n=1 Tax=Kineosporia sp. R_H_3 TaxID=1961848 RepID=UPI001E3129EE|nr:flagellar basal body rod protein FlgC [Kineosporia sp. R_H_3]